MTPDTTRDIDRDRLAAVCHRYGIARLSVFGSVARGAAGEDSDVDLLYETPSRSPARMGSRRSRRRAVEIFGRPVDLVARVALHPMLVETVLGEARPLYAA